jgi:predicted P-loop ATPase
MTRTTPGDNANYFPHPTSDIDVTRIQVWLQRDGGLTRIGLEAVRTAVDIYAHENSFHPVRDWLAELRWDGTKRLDAWLTTVFGVEATSYSTRIGRMFLIAMVARVMEPGCKMDYMLVIDSAQGIKKSSVFEILAGEWFSDAIPKLGSDEIRASMHIRGKWLIEDAELASRGRSSIEEVKQFISRRVERYTPKHGRKEVYEPRQCVFAGTTNELTYLKDETGNRRFWPVSANIDEARDTWLVANRNQLFAEALVAYRAKEPWWPDRKFEEKYIVPEQDARFSGDEWDSTIATFLDLAMKHPQPKITTIQALEGGLGIAVKDIRPGQTVKVGNVIRRLGWVGKCSNGKRWYEPGPKVRKK